MFFYEDKFPMKGTIVVANMKIGDKSDNCMYVTLPEYNNIDGILYRNELPKRLKLQKKAISDMKQAGQIVCVVTNQLVDSNSNLVELSIKGVDTKYHDLILTRYRNIEKFIKLMKFISFTVNIPYYDLVQTLQNTIIIPLDEIDENASVDNYDALYSSCLRDISSFLKFVPLINDNNELKTQVLDSLKDLIKETNASSSLMFDLFVWKGINGMNSVTILQSLLGYIKTKYMDKTVDIRYIGAPRYQLTVRSIELDQIDITYTDIMSSIADWMTNNNIVCYDLQYDILQKEIVHGDISITFPYHIDIMKTID